MPASGKFDLTRSAKMQTAIERIKRFAASRAPLFFAGERGVGKDEAVSFAHARSLRADKALHTVNCPELTATLKSELFGHVKGAFTGAVGESNGLLRAADGGSLYLAEALSLPLELQSALLNVLDDKAGCRVGSTRRESYDFRLIAASRLDPKELINRGDLLQDYLDRIAVLVVEIPPLRERMEDLPALVDALLERAGYQSSFERSFSNDARKKMLDYDWPGNVRELDVVVQRICAFAGAGRVEAEHIERNADIPWFAGVYAKSDEAVIGKPKRGRRSKHPLDDIRRARQLRKEGATLKEVTQKTGIPRSTASSLTR